MNKKQLVIVFARFPEAGKVKSRLIPAIGAEKAAHLQSLLTKHIVSAIAPKIESSQSIPCEDWDISVRFTGSSLDSMKQSIFALDDSPAHLPRIAFAPQSSGDLGSRLADALQEECRKGYERIVVIGTDSPDIDARVID